MTIIVSKELLSKEAKKIKKETGLKHQDILEKIIQAFGFKSYAEYANSLPKHTFFSASKTLNDLDLCQINKLEKNIFDIFKNTPISNIYMISKIKKDKINFYKNLEEGFPLCEELILYPYIYGIKNDEGEYESFLNVDYSFDKVNIDFFINSISEKYINSNLDESIFKSLMSKKTNKRLKDFLFDNNLVELKRFSEEKTQSNNFEDFIVPLIFAYIYKNSKFTKEDFHEEIKKRVLLEKKYKESIPIRKIIFPLLYINEDSFSTNFKNFKLIKKNTSKNFPIFLGTRKDFNLLTQKNIVLSERGAKKNMYIRASLMSGGGDLLSNVIYQHVIRGSGFVYFDCSGSVSRYWEMCSRIKFIDNKEDLYYLSLNNLASITEEMLKSFIINKKKVYIQLSAIDKLCGVGNEDVSREVIRLLELLANIENKRELPYILSFQGSDGLHSAFQTKLNNVIPKLNKNNVSVLLSDTDSHKVTEEKKEIISKMEHKILMDFQGVSSILKEFGFRGILEPGEFLYGLDNDFDFNSIYTMYPLEGLPFKQIILKIPNDYE